MTGINSGAASAREAARQDVGRFGHQGRTAPDDGMSLPTVQDLLYRRLDRARDAVRIAEEELFIASLVICRDEAQARFPNPVAVYGDSDRAGGRAIVEPIGVVDEDGVQHPMPNLPFIECNSIPGRFIESELGDQVTFRFDGKAFR